MFLVSDAALPLHGFALAVSRPGRPQRMSMANGNPPPEQDLHREQAQLVTAMARGEKAALGRLYDQLAGPLYALAHRMLGDAAEAQDLVQDIFLQLWRTAASYEADRGSVFAWAVTLTRNRAIDRLRMRQRRSEILATAAPDLQPSAAAEDGDSAASLWVREKSALVRQALAELPAEQRNAIELAFFGGLTQQEIAERLNEPLGTIKARIRRGLLRLKDRLPSGL